MVNVSSSKILVVDAVLTTRSFWVATLTTCPLTTPTIQLSDSKHYKSAFIYLAHLLFLTVNILTVTHLQNRYNILHSFQLKPVILEHVCAFMYIYFNNKRYD